MQGTRTKRLDLFVFLMLAALLGVLFGTLIYCYVSGDMLSSIVMMREGFIEERLSLDFGSALLKSFFTGLLFMATVYLLGLCALGLRLLLLALGLLHGRLCLRLDGGLRLLLGLCGRRGLRRRLKDLLQALRLVVLGHILKDHIQLRRLQDLHVVFRRRDIIRENLRDHLRGDVEILGHLVDSVLD